MRRKLGLSLALIFVLAFTFSIQAAGPEDLFLDSDAAQEVIKEQATEDWEDDFEMVKYQIDNQTAAYNWLIKVEDHIDLLKLAKEKWDTDYEMIKYEYENQVAAYNWVQSQDEHPEIMAAAKEKWGLDYEMVKYEYENQVEAYESIN